MRLHSRQRIGQAGQEFALSVFFSFFLHAALVILALVFYTATAPKVHIPPFYEVKLVGQPAEILPAPAPEPPPTAPKEEPPPPPEKKTRPKVKKTAPKPSEKALKKDAIPELSQQKQKPEQKEEVKPQPAEQAAPPAPPVAAAKPEGKTEGVAVKTSPGDFKYPAYVAIIRDKIERNWNPPEGPKGMKVTILFTVHRSGKVMERETKLENSTANFYFEQAAIRAILQSSPFPQMPDGFYKESAIFSVDLVKQE